jgi:hypothetical protein
MKNKYGTHTRLLVDGRHQRRQHLIHVANTVYAPHRSFSTTSLFVASLSTFKGEISAMFRLIHGNQDSS